MIDYKICKRLLSMIKVLVMAFSTQEVAAMHIAEMYAWHISHHFAFLAYFLARYSSFVTQRLSK
jgi:hypothetical protein